MQLQLPLVTFEYEHQHKFRTININGEPWFYALDVCSALGISNTKDSVSRLDSEDIGITDGIDSLGRKAKVSIVNESGLYNLIFQSRKEEAKKFKRWITKEVLPQIRKTGAYSPDGNARGLPNFVRRFNDNWDRVDAGHFSIISELFIRIYGRFEQAGHTLAEKGPDGKEIRPDISVGKTFPKWLEANRPNLEKKRKPHRHLLPENIEVDAWQYEIECLPAFIEFIENTWLPKHAYGYLESRDFTALRFLPKLLPGKE